MPRLPRPRGDDADAAGGHRGDDGRAAPSSGNPSSLHTSGRRARRVVEESREPIAAAVGARPTEVRLHLRRHRVRQPRGQGRSSRAAPDADPRRRPAAGQRRRAPRRPGLRRVAGGARGRRGRAGSPVDRLGRVDPDDGARRDRGRPRRRRAGHRDVGQQRGRHGAAGRRDRRRGPRARRPGAHRRRAGGRSGAGRLRRQRRRPADGHRAQDRRPGRRRRAARPARRASSCRCTHGGGQERQVRSGTLDAPAIRGFAVAVDASVGRRDGRGARGWRRCATGWSAARWPRARRRRDAVLARGRRRCDRLPGNAHLLVPGCEGDSLLYLLDAAGVECSTGSACQAGVPQPSHVLLAMGVPEARRPRRAAVHPGPHLDRRRRRRAPRRAAGGASSGPAAPGAASAVARR